MHVVTVKVKPIHPGEMSRTVKLVTSLSEEGEIEFQINGTVTE